MGWLCLRSQCFERNELDLYTFYQRFGEELSNVENNNTAYIKFCKSRGQGEHIITAQCLSPLSKDKLLIQIRRSAEVPKLPTKLQVDGREVSIHSRSIL